MLKAGTGDLLDRENVAAKATNPITVARNTLGCGRTKITKPMSAATVTKNCKFLGALNFRIKARTKTINSVTFVPETAIK